MRPVLALAAVSVALLAGGCGPESDSAGEAREGAAQAGATGPSEPPPKLDIDGPPPAWVEAGDTVVWLAYSTYCWENTCADYVDTRCGVPRIPTLTVERGAELRFHLGFDPTSVALIVRSPQETEALIRLSAGREPAWAATQAGALTLEANAGHGVDARYVACLEFGGGGGGSSAVPAPGGGLTIREALALETDEPVLVKGFVYVEGGTARLCDGLAESYPPQCVGPFLRVAGLAPALTKDLTREGEVAWSEKPVRLRGTLENGVLSVDEKTT